MHSTLTNPNHIFRNSRGRFVASVALSLAATACFNGQEKTHEVGLAASAQAITDDDVGSGTPTDPVLSPVPAPPSFASILSQYQHFDINDDGEEEIKTLTLLPFEAADPDHGATPEGSVIVFVDPRVIADVPSLSPTRAEMLFALTLLRDNLVNEGYYPRFIAAAVYDGTKHQDGLTVLALRRFLKDIYTAFDTTHPLKGAMFIGSFPEASIVRRVFVKEHSDSKEFEGGPQAGTYQNVDYVTAAPELITTRAEIVLGDMDGEWESLYRSKATYPFVQVIPKLPWWANQFPLVGQTFQAKAYHWDDVDFFDFFEIRDEEVNVEKVDANVKVTVSSLDEPGPELSYFDRFSKNRIARPEIVISRINTRHVALMPSSDPDLDGKGPLDAAGKPQTLHYSSPHSIKWQRDAAFERRLLLDYLLRNYLFRTRTSSLPFRTAAIRAQEYKDGQPIESGLTSPQEFNQLLEPAHPDFGTPIAKNNALLDEYVDWLKKPAILRGISAHSSQSDAWFGIPSSNAALSEVVGGAPWAWVSTQENGNYVLKPSVEGFGKYAGLPIHRTIWENKLLASAGQNFFVHIGCLAMRPHNSENKPYNDASYGTDQSGKAVNLETLMFYANGLGVMGRNKDFNDAPQGFSERIAQTGRFGEGWRGYFITTASDASLDERGATGEERRTRTLQRKRSYFWSLLGDFTLKLKY